MIGLRGDMKVLVAARPIDFRRGVHGLVAMVAEALKADPYCGSVFVFRSKRKDRIKMIAWDGTGMVLVTKWLEESGFTFPPISGRRGCADGDSTLRFSRGSRLDQGCREGREKTEGSCLRNHVFSGVSGLFALVFFMALRNGNLPRDPDLLIEMVLAGEGKIEALQATIAKLRTIIFGARSEKIAVIIAEQLSLGLGEAEASCAGPSPANDDGKDDKGGSKTAAQTRKRRNRNIGALPKHLPRVDVTIEPETTTCPCCAGALHRIGEDVNEVVDRVPAGTSGSTHDPPEICLPGLRGHGGSGQGATAFDRERNGLDGARRMDRGGEVRMGLDVVPPSPDLGRPWSTRRPPDIGALDEAGRLDGERPLRVATGVHAWTCALVLRRNAGSDARSGAGSNENMPILGACDG